MILPTKHLSIKNSMLGVGAMLLTHLESPKTVGNLWYEIRTDPNIGNYERFISTLDLLFIIGAIEVKGNTVYRCKI